MYPCLLKAGRGLLNEIGSNDTVYKLKQVLE